MTDSTLSEEIAQLLEAAHHTAGQHLPDAEMDLAQGIEHLIQRRTAGLEAAVIRLASEIEALKG